MLSFYYRKGVKQMKKQTSYNKILNVVEKLTSIEMMKAAASNDVNVLRSIFNDQTSKPGSILGKARIVRQFINDFDDPKKSKGLEKALKEKGFVDTDFAGVVKQIDTRNSKPHKYTIDLSKDNLNFGKDKSGQYSFKDKVKAFTKIQQLLNETSKKFKNCRIVLDFRTDKQDSSCYSIKNSNNSGKVLFKKFLALLAKLNSEDWYADHPISLQNFRVIHK